MAGQRMAGSHSAGSRGWWPFVGQGWGTAASVEVGRFRSIQGNARSWKRFHVSSALRNRSGSGGWEKLRLGTRRPGRRLLELSKSWVKERRWQEQDRTLVKVRWARCSRR